MHELLVLSDRELAGARQQQTRLKTRWRLGDGTLGSVYRAEDCIDAEPLVADLGDTAPFLAALGEREAALELAHSAAAHLVRGLYRRGERAYLFDNHDLLLGWLELHEHTGAPWLLERCAEGLNSVKREHEIAGRLMDWAEPRGHAWRASSFNAGFIEVALDLFHATRHSEYLAWAQTWAEQLLCARSFQQHGFWSRFDTPRLPWLGVALGRLSRQGPCRMFKDNTNCVWGLLALARLRPAPQLRSALDRFVESVGHAFAALGHVPQYPGRSTEFDLSANVFVADLLADIAHFLEHEAALHLACQIVEGIERRRWRNGLVPRGSAQPGDHLDIMTDYGVALCKLDELGAAPGLRELAALGWSATWRLHGSDHGLVLSVDHDGRVVDDRIIVKYQFLATKALFIGNRTNIYAAPALWRLLRDR